jgi:hypothetical protein
MLAVGILTVAAAIVVPLFAARTHTIPYTLAVLAAVFLG